MNQAQRKTFGRIMAQAKRRGHMTAGEKTQLAKLRHNKVKKAKTRSTAKTRRFSVAGARAIPKRNPAVEIYPRVMSVVARKGPGHPCDAACKRANHTYIHRFKPGARMMGERDGSLSIRSRS